MKYDFHTLVIGAGSGGLTVAFGLAAAGKKVALVEGRALGGDCTNFGCIPSKALIDIAKSGKYTSLQEALQEVRARRLEIQEEETKEKIEEKGIQVYEGYTHFLDDHRVQVDDSTILSGRYIVVATGSHAQTLDIPGIIPADILTNEEIFEQTENIQNIVVIGGGYIGCELAESISHFGVTTHILQRNMLLVPREEKESSLFLQETFEKKGILVHTGVNISRAQDKTLFFTHANGEENEISYDKILVALGRVPNISKLDLEKAGVKYSKQGIEVDRYNRTQAKHIFAIGDVVAGNPQFTHWANNEGRGVIRNILLPFPKSSVRALTIPSVLYTHSEIARVGKTKQELLEIYHEDEFLTKMLPFSLNDRSKVTHTPQGFIQIHISRLRGKILGVTIVGTGAGELISFFTLAMDQKISVYKLAKLVYPYPTKSDLIKRVCDLFVVDTLSHLKREIFFLLRSNILQIITFILWAFLISIFLWYKATFHLSLEDIAFQLYDFIKGNIWGPVLYIFAYAIRPIILFPATLMTFMSGALFGFVGGFFYTLIGETMSAVLAYMLGNIFGKKMLRNTKESGVLAYLGGEISKKPFLSVLSTRLLFFPFDLTNYACGFLKVPLKYFTLATFIGIIPGMSVFILAGAAFYSTELTSFSQAIAEIDTRFLLYAAIVFCLTLIGAKVFKKYTS